MQTFGFPPGKPGFDSVISSSRRSTVNSTRSAQAVAPAKVILFGEHAINRGQPALAAGVGLWASCRVSLGDDAGIILRSGPRKQAVSRESILSLSGKVDAFRRDQNYESIRQLAAQDYFAPAKYILGSALGERVPNGFTVEWESEIPSSAGLGSGAAAFTAMVTALDALLLGPATLEARSEWSHLGDIVAHGGVASALDSQTSLLGGIIQFNGQGLAEPIPCATGFSLVIGSTGISASTSEIITKVRRWLEEKPASRLAYFQTVGTLSRAALPALKKGDWNELGLLLTLNQLALEKIGVSCPEIDRLIEAVLEAGALGAKLSGSGGGGIIIALVTAETRTKVAQAIVDAGGTAFLPEIGVPGASLRTT